MHDTKFYSIMIIPHGPHGKPVSIKIPVSWAYIGASIALFSFLLVISSVIYSTLVSRRLIHYTDTLTKNREQHAVISSFSKALEELTQKENELRKLLGLKNWQRKVKTNAFDQADLKLAERKESLEELKNWVNFVRSRFTSTPSAWPIYGRIMSYMGYRSYPWRGFHAGIDVQGRRGALVRATAAGVVSYIGWRHGYGKTIEINHGNGVSTLYAHNSGYAVNVGQKVRKGQVICYVGTTGWTTGPHLHYEVHRWGRPLNPVAFLNLNILSASRLWRD